MPSTNAAPQLIVRAKVRWEKKCRKPEPNICEHVDNHHKVVMIRCWPNRNVTNTQRWRVLIMTWTPCICVRSCLQKIVSGALLSSMFFIELNTRHTEYCDTQRWTISYFCHICYHICISTLDTWLLISGWACSWWS